MKTPPAPDFRSPTFLRQHIVWIMDFYATRATDPSGGMYHYFLDDGTVFDARTRHLVNATRFVITHAMLYKLTGEARYRAGVATRSISCATPSSTRRPVATPG